MFIKKLVAVLIGSAVIGICIGMVISKAPAALRRDDQPRGIVLGVPAEGVVTEELPLLPLPVQRPSRSKAKGRAETPYRVLRKGRDGKPAWVETAASINARRALTFAVKEEEDRIHRMRPGQGTMINGNAPDDLGPPGIRKAFAEAFAELDPQPEMRKEHFRWVAERGLNQVGWYAAFRRLERSQDGWLVEIKVMPHIEQPGGIWTVGDFCVERWVFADGVLTMLPFEHAHPRRGAIAVD